MELDADRERSNPASQPAGAAEVPAEGRRAPAQALCRTLGPPLLADLSFREAWLEEAFMRHYQASKAVITARFAIFRAAAHLFLACRALVSGDLLACLVFLLASSSSLVPPVVTNPALAARRFAGWPSLAAILLVDVAQAAVGCVYLHFIAPSKVQEHMSPAASLSHLIHGSGMLWPVFYSSFCSLPFRFQWVVQAAVCLVLLCFRASVCAGNSGLRQGYHVAQQALLKALTPLALLHTHNASASAGSGSHGNSTAAAAAAWAPVPQQGLDLQLCVQGQALLLLLPGFLGAMWALYRAELRLRLRWLAALQRQHWEGAARHAAGHSGSSAGRPAGESAGCDAQPRRDGPLAPCLPADVARLTADLAPCDLDFLLNFALPAAAAMWVFVC